MEKNKILSTPLEGSVKGLGIVYKHRQVSPEGQMTIFEHSALPKQMEQEKSRSMDMLYNVMNGTKKSWQPGEVGQVVEYILESYESAKAPIHIDKGTIEHLTGFVTRQLDEMGAQYDKKKEIRIEVDDGKKKAKVEVWYSRRHKLPLYTNPVRFYIKVESTTLEGL